jgi:hypothetical protein
MKTTLALLLAVLFLIGCSESINGPELKVGEASVTIENVKHSAKADMAHQTILESDFEKITLTINDSLKIEILREHFTKEKTRWTTEDFVSQDIIFSLQYNHYRGTAYIPFNGWFEINSRTDSNIVGEFDITMHDGAASCMTCPETLKQVSGKFKTKIN